MESDRHSGLIWGIILALYEPRILLAVQTDKLVSINPETMPRISSVDPRFQPYNIEMVEVTGGRLWKPYASQADANREKQPDGNQPAGWAGLSISRTRA
jgi:hypothetical protein